MHLVRVQNAATKAVPNVTDFLQVGTVIYGQTKARGRGIVNNAKDLGLRFKPYALPEPDDDRLSGFMLQKLHGTKLHGSVSFYDKLIRLQQMHQEGTLTPAEVQTVDRSVREDITAHSTFIQYIAEAAQKKLRRMSEADRKFFDLISPEEFLQGTPQPTVWWLQRAIYVLSHWHVQGRWLRYSFGAWLVPFVDEELLHLDVIASITTEATPRAARAQRPGRRRLALRPHARRGQLGRTAGPDRRLQPVHRLQSARPMVAGVRP